MDDLETMACPPKYRELNTFYKYYSGEAQAPIPTLFSETFLLPQVQMTRGCFSAQSGGITRLPITSGSSTTAAGRLQTFTFWVSRVASSLEACVSQGSLGSTNRQEDRPRGSLYKLVC